MRYGDNPAYHRSTDKNASQLPSDNVKSQLIGPLKDWAEALNLDQTIEASTINGAKTLNMEDEIGTIEVGKKADILVLNMNIRKAPVEKLEKIAPAYTFFDGKLVFDKNGKK